jgi:hypothetical protein
MTYGLIFFLVKFDFKGNFAKLPTKLGLLVVVVDPRYISDFSCYRGFQEPVDSNISVIDRIWVID